MYIFSGKNSLMEIKNDCMYFFGSRPCLPHKLTGIFCEVCDKFDQIKLRILIVKLDALGDVLRTTAILPAIHKKYPNAAITWITRRNAISLLKNNIWIWKLLAVEDNYLEYILGQEFDAAFSLDPDFLSATILRLCRSDKKYGFIANKDGAVVPVNELSQEWYCMGIRDDLKKSNRKTFFDHIYKICDLEPPYSRPQYQLTKEQRLLAQNYKKEKGLSKYRKIVGINTGGGTRWQYKKWLQEYYIELVALLANKHPDIGILLYGGPDEIDFNNVIMNKVGRYVIDVGCRNTLDVFSALVSLSDIFLTPDSLGMHISVAIDIITIAMVGPTAPWELDVFGKGEIIWSDMDCIGCYLNQCHKNDNCMSLLRPAVIFRKIEKYL